MNRKDLERKPTKNFWNAVVVSIVALVLLMPGYSVCANESDTTVGIQPASQTVETGETFTASYYVEPTDWIIGANFVTISFDPTLLQADSVTKGTFFGGKEIMFSGGAIDNTLGTISDGFALVLVADAVNANGSVFVISFTAKDKLGTSALVMNGVTIKNNTGVSIPITVESGSVTVGEESSVEWDVTLNFNEYSGKHDYVVFGEAADANDGESPDSYDAPKPPEPQPPYIQVWFDDSLPEPYDRLRWDYRQYPDTNKIWDLYVHWISDSTTPTNVTISWDTSEFNDCEYNSVVLWRYDPFDMEWDFAADMFVSNNYVYTPWWFNDQWLTDHFQIVATEGSWNNPPYMPSVPNPNNGATGVDINADLSWTGGDPDPGDVVMYDIYLGIETSSPKIVSGQFGTSFDPGTLSYDTTYYWKIVSWDNHGAKADGSLWSFTVGSSSNGGSNGGGNGGSTGEENQPPIANASASETFGFVGTLLLFSGSLSNDVDGYIISWSWDFGDNKKGSGEVLTHAYADVGTYIVTLTVVDNNSATDSDAITVVVSKANNAPKKPIVTGKTTGNKNTEYAYTAVSTDEDNDTIKYTFDWGDGSTNESEFLLNGTSFTITHSWIAAGRYTLTVTVTDNETVSSSELITVFIDAVDVDNLGYLVDIDGDGIYDMFRSYDNEIETVVEQQNNGSYLIDIDGDGQWDYIFDLVSGITTYNEENKQKETPGFELFLTICAIAIVIVYITNRRRIWR